MADTDEATVGQIAKLYDEHDRRTTRVQRFANRVTSTMARPLALLMIFGIVVAWISGNYVAHLLGSHALDEFPFPDLEFVATIVALLVALLILTTQRHQDELAERRAQLTLHIAMLSERKIAKLIELMEEQRRDNPLLPSRDDHEAATMAQPSDHGATLDRIGEVAEQRLQPVETVSDGSPPIADA